MEFRPGFRISGLDVGVLIIGSCGTILAGLKSLETALIIGLVVGHFFLFCNVFRISRSSELIWAFIFIGLATSARVTEVVSWALASPALLMVTLIIIILEMRRPSYHGIFWRKVNPRLPQWWNDHTG